MTANRDKPAEQERRSPPETEAPPTRQEVEKALNGLIDAVLPKAPPQPDRGRAGRTPKRKS